MIDKICDSVRSAVAGIQNGSTVMIGGFGSAGQSASGEANSSIAGRLGYTRHIKAFDGAQHG